MPLCLLYFDVKSDAGYFAWILEPISDSLSTRSLRFHRERTFVKLDDDRVDTIVRQVNHWYSHQPAAA